MLDRKGIFSYLAITFTLTYLIEGALIASGFSMQGLPPAYSQLVIAGVMWIPALATVITIRFVTHEGFAITNLRFGPWRPYVAAALLMPVIFAVIYGLTWLLGLGAPDWQLTAFRQLVTDAGGDISSAPGNGLILLGVLLVSILVGPTINGVFGFGEEFGWRGYLLPKLMPLGKVRAYSWLGVIWGLWHAPLILVGFNYPGYPLLGILAMIGLTTAFGITLNEMTLRYRSSILAGSIHGAFNGQSYGIWRSLLFPSVNPLLGGIAGVVGIVVWLLVGLWLARRPMPDSSYPPGSVAASSQAK